MLILYLTQNLLNSLSNDYQELESDIKTVLNDLEYTIQYLIEDNLIKIYLNNYNQNFNDINKIKENLLSDKIIDIEYIELNNLNNNLNANLATKDNSIKKIDKSDYRSDNKKNNSINKIFVETKLEISKEELFYNKISNINDREILDNLIKKNDFNNFIEKKIVLDRIRELNIESNKIQGTILSLDDEKHIENYLNKLNLEREYINDNYRESIERFTGFEDELINGFINIDLNSQPFNNQYYQKLKWFASEIFLSNLFSENEKEENSVKYSDFKNRTANRGLVQRKLSSLTRKNNNHYMSTPELYIKENNLEQEFNLFFEELLKENKEYILEYFDNKITHQKEVLYYNNKSKEVYYKDDNQVFINQNIDSIIPKINLHSCYPVFLNNSLFKDDIIYLRQSSKYYLEGYIDENQDENISNYFVNNQSRIEVNNVFLPVYDEKVHPGNNYIIERENYQLIYTSYQAINNINNLESYKGRLQIVLNNENKNINKEINNILKENDLAESLTESIDKKFDKPGRIQLELDDYYSLNNHLILAKNTHIIHGMTSGSDLNESIKVLEKIIHLGGLKSIKERYLLGYQNNTTSPLGDIQSGLDSGVPCTIGDNPNFGNHIFFVMSKSNLKRRNLWFAPRDFGGGHNRYKEFQNYAKEIGQENIYDKCPYQTREKHLKNRLEISNEVWFKDEIKLNDIQALFVDNQIYLEVKKIIKENNLNITVISFETDSNNDFNNENSLTNKLRKFISY